ncbi:MAG: hypothetical protein CML01_12260 [Pseudomonas sp.]|nr:hypothetical protein [Pseudomonas sp.]|tara:strand:- start:43790 stop:44989 length:1200 start_codon:yes stop_codon:yes gene_type:complete
MLFYAQQVDKKVGTAGYSVILDTARLAETLELSRLLGASEEDLASENLASMLRFDYLPDSYFGCREGSWYEIPDEFWEGWGYHAVDPTGPGSVFLRGELSAPGGKKNFSRHLTAPIFIERDTVSASDYPLIGPNDWVTASATATLSVIDCGHGNWNEIRTDNLRLMYDVGASRLYDASQVARLVQSQAIGAQGIEVKIYISHWDVDHYQSILKFTYADLSVITEVTAPSQLPNTATCKRILALLDNHEISVRLLPPAPRATRGHTIDLIEIQRAGPLTVFRATAGRSRNQSGIVLCYESQNKLVLLVGDHHYEKILNAIQGRFSPAKDCVFVAPHHGGNAGSIDVSAWRAMFSSFETVISCGDNSWNHPLVDNLNGLSELQSNIASWRTDHDGTLHFTL